MSNSAKKNPKHKGLTRKELKKQQKLQPNKEKEPANTENASKTSENDHPVLPPAPSGSMINRTPLQNSIDPKKSNGILRQSSSPKKIESKVEHSIGIGQEVENLEELINGLDDVVQADNFNSTESHGELLSVLPYTNGDIEKENLSDELSLDMMRFLEDLNSEEETTYNTMDLLFKRLDLSQKIRDLTEDIDILVKRAEILEEDFKKIKTRSYQDQLEKLVSPSEEDFDEDESDEENFTNIESFMESRNNLMSLISKLIDKEIFRVHLVYEYRDNSDNILENIHINSTDSNKNEFYDKIHRFLTIESQSLQQIKNYAISDGEDDKKTHLEEQAEIEAIEQEYNKKKS